MKKCLAQGRSVLVVGPSGVGKTMAVREACRELGMRVLVYTASDVEAHEPGYPERTIARIAAGLHQEARTAGKTVVIWDRIDEIVPRSTQTTPLVLDAFAAMLRSNALHSDSGCVHVGITHDERLICEYIRALFADTLAIDPPKTASDRLALLHKVTDGLLTATHRDEELSRLAQLCHGLKLADVQAIAADAVRRAQTRKISTGDLFAARKSYIPRDGTAAFLPKPIEPVGWDQIGGLSSVKAAVQDALIWAQHHRPSFDRMCISPPRGMLLFGPPGTGKTMLAKAGATAMSGGGGQFIAATIPDLLRAEVGESEKAIAKLFAQARQHSPSLIFLDEIETLFGTKDSDHSVQTKMVSQLLLELDDLEHSADPDAFVFVLAATNAPDRIDEALLRPGRLDTKAYVGPPAMEERLQILDIYSRPMKRAADLDLASLSARTNGFTGADLYALCQRAAMNTIDRVASIASSDADAAVVTMADFESALADSSPSVQPGDQLVYLSFCS